MAVARGRESWDWTIISRQDSRPVDRYHTIKRTKWDHKITVKRVGGKKATTYHKSTMQTLKGKDKEVERSRRREKIITRVLEQGPTAIRRSVFRLRLGNPWNTRFHCTAGTWDSRDLLSGTWSRLTAF